MTQEISIWLIEQLYNCYVHHFEYFDGNKSTVVSHVDERCRLINLTAIGDNWRQVDEQAAKRLLWLCLKHDIVYFKSNNSNDEYVKEEYDRILNHLDTQLVTQCFTNLMDLDKDYPMVKNHTQRLSHMEADVGLIIVSAKSYLFLQIGGDLPYD